MSGWIKKYRAPALVFLVVVATAGALLFLARRSEPIEIVAPPETSSPRGTVYVSGAVANPGLYPWGEGDSVADIIRAAGLLYGADTSAVKLYVPGAKELSQSQRVNLNTAEAWLIGALPGIGETRAGAIIEYRKEKGRFSSPGELTQVKGIGVTTYERIKDLITVSD
ncbi:MAG: ComEA family DNA-binding protein [Dehalococcoidia bacterium]|nr:ComEA family DNA-binding protein [Dehalococcoidia bacterium]